MIVIAKNLIIYIFNVKKGNSSYYLKHLVCNNKKFYIRLLKKSYTKMVRRSLTQWTKTLSFPSANSNKSSKSSANKLVATIAPSCTSLNYCGGEDLQHPPGYESPPPSMPNISAPMIYPDPQAEKAIMASVVYCIHHKEGCQWAGELRKLKAHLNTCKHDATPCTGQCGAMIPRVLMEDHLRYTCPQRRARCEFCGQDFTGLTLEAHSGTCGYEPVYCENKCGLKVARRLGTQHRAAECSKRLVGCRYCTKEFVADTLAAHHTKCGRFPLPCPNRCGSTEVAREELELHLKERCQGPPAPALPPVTSSQAVSPLNTSISNSMVCCTFKDAGCRFKGSRSALEQHTEESQKAHISLLSNLAARQQRQIVGLRTALAKLSLNTSGTLIWRISDLAAKMAEAKTREGVELLSPVFLTSQYGYKLQASLFLNGNGAGDNSHLSVYIKILPGEYDALLRWPFAHSVSFTIFDQSTVPEKACNIVESFIPDPTWRNFQRPSREPDSLGFGFPRFVSHDTLRRRHYTRDDTIFIRVKVDPSKIVAV